MVEQLTKLSVVVGVELEPVVAEPVFVEMAFHSPSEVFA